MEKQRVEALSDAILAIIVTIMALELQLPEDYPNQHLFSSPSY